MRVRSSWFFAALVVACGTHDEAPDAATNDAQPTNDAIATDASTADAADADAAKPLGAPRVYIGSGDGKIRVYAFDTSTYALTPVATTATGGTPSFLAIDDARAFLYAVDESGSQVDAFAIDPGTGKLTALGAVSSLGSGPAYVGLDEANALVMVANYGGGTIAVFPRGTDGRLGDASATHAFGASALSHEIVSDPSNAFVLVANKGLDGVGVFRRDGGALSYLGLTEAGGGARHMAFDPPGTHTYVIDENASTIEAFGFDTSTGTLSFMQALSSRIDASAATNTGAEIQITNDGKHVVASNRGDDTLVVFDVDSAGKLTPKTSIPTGGQTPRHFRIDETGRFLFVANQTSGSVVTMTMDPQTGIPSPVGTALAVPQPEFVALVYLPL